MTAVDANIFNIERSSFVDGPGIRTVVFFKGCNLKCEWCHNPESWSAKPVILYFGEKCTKCGLCKAVCSQSAVKENFYVDYTKCSACAKCVSVCPNNARKLYGKHISVEKLFEIIAADKPFFDTSGGGVTFSGGECMLQIDVLEMLIDLCNKAGISVAVDTAGNIPLSYYKRVIDKVDYFLFDIKCMDSALHKKMTGASNEQILSGYRFIHFRKPDSLIVRIPIIPGVNDTKEEQDAIFSFLSVFPPAQIDILPYHRLGEVKQKSLSVGTSFSVPDEDVIRKIQARFNRIAVSSSSN